MRTQKLLEAAGTLVVLHSSIRPASAQNCYYPNGDVARTDASCSPDGGACCPLGWDCLSNGLCFLGNEQYFGRYTCTDRDWGGDCPQYCTSNNTAAGNEAIVQCSDGSWCCDKNRDPQKPDCCSWDDKEVIAVPDGSTVTSITSTPEAPSSVPPFTRSPASATSAAATTSDGVTTSSSRLSTTTSQSPSTITTRATSSDSTGGIVVITSIVTTSAPGPMTTTQSTESEYGHDHSAPDNGVVIGVSIGVSIGVIIFFVALYVLWRRRKQKWAAQRSPPTSDYPNNHMSFMYSHGKNAHEIDSFPVAVPGARDKSRPISELTGSNHFMPGSPVSSMHTGVSPPGYSPSVNGSVSAGTTMGGWTNSPTFLPGVEEQPEPQELPPEGNPPRESLRVPMAPAPAAQTQPAKKTEMAQSTGGGLFTYEPYRPYRPEELVKTGETSCAAQSKCAVGEEALRTMSPDPPQPIQGGLRVVNQ